MSIGVTESCCNRKLTNNSHCNTASFTRWRYSICCHLWWLTPSSPCVGFTACWFLSLPLPLLQHSMWPPLILPCLHMDESSSCLQVPKCSCFSRFTSFMVVNISVLQPLKAASELCARRLILNSFPQFCPFDDRFACKVKNNWVVVISQPVLCKHWLVAPSAPHLPLPLPDVADCESEAV